MWESEFHYLWQQQICHCVCSLVHIYIKAPKSRVDCSLWLRISDNPVHMYHVTFILHDQAIHPSSFHSIIRIISGGRSNLWSYTLCSFLQFPITFSYKSPTTDQHQHCSQTQSTVYPQCHRPTITPTSIKILHKQTHTCLYFNSHIFRKQEEHQNTMKL